MHNFLDLADLFQMFCIPVPASIPTQGAENLFVANKNHKEENTLEDNKTITDGGSTAPQNFCYQS